VRVVGSDGSFLEQEAFSPTSQIRARIRVWAALQRRAKA